MESFSPIPREPLPFPSLLVASRNDPHTTFEASNRIAAMWGSSFIDAGTIGSKVAKEVFQEMAESGEAPDAIVERRGLAQVADPAVIRDAAQRVVEQHPTQVAQYRGGKTQVFGFLVGQLMKQTRGKAKAELANEILKELLDV